MSRAFVVTAGVAGTLIIGAAFAAIILGETDVLRHPRTGGGPGAGGASDGAFDGVSVPADEAEKRLTLGNPTSSGLAEWPGVLDAEPVAFDIDGEGVQEIVAHSNDTDVYVFDGETGRVLATLPTAYPPEWYIERVLNAPAVGVLEPGASPSVVVANHAAHVSVWTYDPAASTDDSFVLNQTWDRRVNDCFENAGMDARPVLADLDDDGRLEIVVQTEEVGIFALAANGSILWHHCWGGGNADALVDDLDDDGDLEVVFASDDGRINVLDGATGQPQWSFDAAAHGIDPASVPVAPTAAELDGKAPKELLFTARHAPADDPSRYDEFHMAVFAVHQDPQTGKGDLLWMRQPEWAHPLSYTHLVVEDVDADGEADIFGMDWNTIGHHPGNWENLGNAHAFRLTAQGDDVWVQAFDSWWSNKDVVLADTDGDGEPELLVNGAHEGKDGLWRLSAATGEPETFLSTWPWKVMRAPFLFDLDHDGGLDMALPVAPDEAEPSHGAILLFQLQTTTD